MLGASTRVPPCRSPDRWGLRSAAQLAVCWRWCGRTRTWVALAAPACWGCLITASDAWNKAQLLPILKAGLSHNGLALVDVISPCVTFNDHEGSTKSYAFTREHEVELAEADFVPLRREITMPANDATVQSVQMHDGSTVRFRRLEEGYDPTNRDLAYAHVRACQARGEMATGLLFIDENGADMHAVAKTVDTPLAELPFETLCPGQTALQALMDKYR